MPSHPTLKPSLKRDEKFRQLKREGMRMFVASRRGSNAKGIGANRSVVLSSHDGKEWSQHAKFFGPRHAQDAADYIKWFNSL